LKRWQGRCAWGFEGSLVTDGFGLDLVFAVRYNMQNCAAIRVLTPFQIVTNKL
jgi:hypothetical protein